jgi:cullin 1
LRFYIEEWAYYTRSAKCIDHIFRYLCRHWIKREMNEGKNNVYDVYTLHLVQWFGELVQEISGDVTEAVLKLMEKHRNGETIENSQTKAVADSFASLRLDDTDPPKPTLDLYRYHFERPFIEAIKADYQSVSAPFLSENLVVKCRNAVSLLEEEEQHVTLYLHPDIKPQLTKACNNTAPSLKLATNDYAVIEVGKWPPRVPLILHYQPLTPIQSARLPSGPPSSSACSRTLAMKPPVTSQSLCLM